MKTKYIVMIMVILILGVIAFFLVKKKRQKPKIETEITKNNVPLNNVPSQESVVDKPVSMTKWG